MEGPKRDRGVDVIAVLRQSQEVRVVHEAAPKEHVQINAEGFETPFDKQQAHVLDEVQDTADACAEFLSLPVIADSFASHGERLQWANSQVDRFGPSFSQFYMTNALRFNAINSVRLNLETLENGLRIYKVDSEKSKQVSSLIDSMPNVSEYDTLSNEEKLALVETLRQKCREFIDLVAQKAA